MTESTDTTEEAESPPVWKRIPWRRMVHIVGLVVLLVVVVPFVIYAVPQVVGASQSYVVLSGSMEPVMSPGDVVVVDSTDPSNIEQGDVITFAGASADRPTTHRVIDVRQQDDSLTFETKGDANEDADAQLVSPGDVRGKVMSVGGYPFIIPLIGHVIQFANTQVGFVALFVVPIALLVLSEIWNIVSGSAGSDDDTGDETEASEEAVTADAGSETADDGRGTDDTEESGEPALTFQAFELQLGLVILGLFLAYSIWVGYATREIWAFSVAGTVGATFLLLSGLYIVGGSDADDDSDSASQSDDSGDAADPIDPDDAIPEIDIDEEIAILEGDSDRGDALVDGPDTTSEARSVQGGHSGGTDPAETSELAESLWGPAESNGDVDRATGRTESEEGD